MKKLFIGLFLGVFAFASCLKVENVSESRAAAQEEIVFSTGRRAITKAIVEGTTFPVGSTFGAYGYVVPNAGVTNGGYLMEEAEYYAEGANIGTPADGKTYYWPKADNYTDINVNFVAYFPYTYAHALDVDATDRSVKNNLVFNVVANGENTDFLYATAANEHPQNAAVSPYVARKVDLTFHHAFSLIEFRAKRDTTIKSVEVTSIAFSSPLKQDATLTFNMNDLSSSPVLTAGSTDRTVNNYAIESAKSNISDSEYSLLSSNIVVPQTVPAQLTITFNLVIENVAGEEIHYNGRTVTKTVNTGTDMGIGSTYASYVSSFAAGTRYVFRFFVTAEGIDFTVDIDDWTNNDVFQVWDHATAQANIEHFFGSASTLMGQSLAIA